MGMERVQTEEGEELGVCLDMEKNPTISF